MNPIRKVNSVFPKDPPVDCLYIVGSFLDAQSLLRLQRVNSMAKSIFDSAEIYKHYALQEAARALMLHRTISTIGQQIKFHLKPWIQFDTAAIVAFCPQLEVVFLQATQTRTFTADKSFLLFIRGKEHVATYQNFLVAGIVNERAFGYSLILNRFAEINLKTGGLTYLQGCVKGNEEPESLSEKAQPSFEEINKEVLAFDGGGYFFLQGNFDLYAICLLEEFAVVSYFQIQNEKVLFIQTIKMKAVKVEICQQGVKEDKSYIRLDEYIVICDRGLVVKSAKEFYAKEPGLGLENPSSFMVVSKLPKSNSGKKIPQAALRSRTFTLDAYNVSQTRLWSSHLANFEMIDSLNYGVSHHAVFNFKYVVIVTSEEHKKSKETRWSNIEAFDRHSGRSVLSKLHYPLESVESVWLEKGKLFFENKVGEISVRDLDNEGMSLGMIDVGSKGLSQVSIISEREVYVLSWKSWGQGNGVGNALYPSLVRYRLLA